MSKGIALHIGINKVDNEYYGVEIPPLLACENDAIEWEKISQSKGFNSQVLLSSSATADNIIKQIKNSAKQLKSGDVFFLTYSGHGSQIPDLNHDEEDSLDECWIAYDKPILDDELEILWTKFNEGVKIVLISDSCHSGTMVKSLKRRKILHPRNLSFTVRNQIWSDHKKYNKLIKKLDKLADKKGNLELKANIICLSACQDYQLAFEGENHGLFTECLLKIIHQNEKPKRGQKPKRLTANYLINTAKKMLKGKQIPMYYKSDNITRTYLLQEIFSLTN